MITIRSPASSRSGQCSWNASVSEPPGSGLLGTCQRAENKIFKATLVNCRASLRTWWFSQIVCLALMTVSSRACHLHGEEKKFLLYHAFDKVTLMQGYSEKHTKMSNLSQLQSLYPWASPWQRRSSPVSQTSARGLQPLDDGGSGVWRPHSSMQPPAWWEISTCLSPTVAKHTKRKDVNFVVSWFSAPRLYHILSAY